MKSILLKMFVFFIGLQSSFAGNINLNIMTNPELSPQHLSQSKSIQLPLIPLHSSFKQMRALNLVTKAENLPAKIQLGMANVPVLDQGIHGSCVTFAVTAALDALDKLGDYYSQLCFLQLGSYLYQNGKGLSGWDGLNGYTAFKRINTYGLMTKNQQKTYGCGGLKSYPLEAENTGAMSIDDYKQYAKIPQFTQKYLFGYLPNKVDAIKQSLSAGHRVIVGVYLPRADLGIAGAVATHHFYNDTWILTDDIKNDIKTQQSLPGHMMVVSGYDDTLIAKDSSGKEHKGLFILRNSWGKYVGDAGTFYMSYEFMNMLAHDAYELTSTVDLSH